MPRAGYTWSRRAKVHIVTLDELVQSRAFAPDIIKIDVEGSEFNVLTGAAQVLSMFKPLLIIEVHPEHVSKIGHDPSLISAFLQDRGYMIYSFDDHRSTGVSSLTEIRKITKAHDHVIVCVHQTDSDRRLSLTATGLIRRSNSE
jgi:hypothetical protein